MPTHPGGDCRRVMESSASPVLTRPTNSLARLGMLPTQAMTAGEAINLGITSSWKTNSTPVPCRAARHGAPGGLTVLGAAPGHHAVGPGRVETAANGDFQLGQNGLSTAG